ncbi:MAG: DNA polymerase III subunit delta' [Pseudomonadota bacterium]
MSDDAYPEADARDGAPHPRFASLVYGHEHQTSEVVSARGGNLHHAWMLAGPRGIGKATFAWKLAETLLGTPPDDGLFGAEPITKLGLEDGHPVKARLQALSEPRLALIRRAWDDRAKRLKTQITVDEVRKLHGFLSLSAPDGGRRVVLIDAADEMNITAANAVLKLLEEPPADTVFLLVTHQPAGLLPTIRSRCRMLRFDPLSPEHLSAALAAAEIDAPPGQETALAILSQGSVGVAIGLIAGDGLGLYTQIIEVLKGCPNLDRQAALTLANATSGRGAEAKRDMTLQLFEMVLARLARFGAGGEMAGYTHASEAELCEKLAPNLAASQTWADAGQTLTTEARRAIAVNLDPSHVILDMILKMNELAGRVVRP